MQDAQALCAVPSSLQVRCTYTYVRVYIRIYAHICKRCRSVCWCCYSFYYSGSISYLVQKTHKKHTKNTQSDQLPRLYYTHTHSATTHFTTHDRSHTGTKALLSYLVQKLLIGYATPKHAKRSTNTSDRSSVWAHTRS